MQDLGRVLIAVGIILVLAGVLLYWSKGAIGLGKLPGDIIIRKNNFTFYFPLVTSLLLSIVLTLLFYFINKK